ncbi:MAG: T9SS type A sorting domain-containing protein [Flavobacteriales bacterium]|nr:T9SS type A sorting domain-containing protein [Flavobacteriales bacterium]
MKSIFTLLIALLPFLTIAQNISSIVPSSGNNGETLNVTITGVNTNFSQASSALNFNFGNIYISANGVNSYTVVNSTTINANITIPANTYIGDYNIYYSNDITNEYFSVTDGFYVNGIIPPTITSVTPLAGVNGQTLDVTITGANTNFTPGSTTLHFGFGQASETVNYYNFTSNTQFSANITIPQNTYTDSYYVQITSPIAGYLYGPNDFEVTGITPPNLVSISPPSALSGQTLNVTITGENTNFSQVNNNVYFNISQSSGTVNVNSIEVINDFEMEVNVSANSILGTSIFDVATYNSIDGYQTLNDAFSVYNDGVTNIYSVEPQFADAGTTLDITIIGTNTNFVQGLTTVEFYFDSNIVLALTNGDATVNSITVINSEMLIANITVPTVIDGTGFDVIVASPSDGPITVMETFTVTVPSIENTINTALNVYPIPTLDRLSVEKENSLNGLGQITITDIEGKTVIVLVSSNNKENIDVSSLESGLYILEITDSNGNSTSSKFIKE